MTHTFTSCDHRLTFTNQCNQDEWRVIAVSKNMYQRESDDLVLNSQYGGYLYGSLEAAVEGVQSAFANFSANYYDLPVPTVNTVVEAYTQSTDMVALFPADNTVTTA